MAMGVAHSSQTVRCSALEIIGKLLNLLHSADCRRLRSSGHIAREPKFAARAGVPPCVAPAAYGLVALWVETRGAPGSP